MEWEKKPNASAGVVQPLCHQPPFLGVSPLAGGEKAKVQFKPKTDIGEEGKYLCKQWKNIHQSLQPATG